MEWILLGVSLVMVAACAFFVAAEFSFVTVDRVAVKQQAESGDRAAKGVAKALANLSTQLSGAQVGITITNLAIGFLAQPSIAALIQEPLISLGIPPDAVPAIAIAIGLILATVITMIFGELVPKNIAIARPLGTAKATQGFQRTFSTVAGLLIKTLNGTANAILRVFGVEPQEELRSARSAQELSSVVKRSERHGTLDPSTANLLERTLAFGERCAGDIMTPRMRTVFVESNDSASHVIEQAIKTGNSRFPVAGADSDDIVGIVHLKQAIAVPIDLRDSVTIGDICVSPTTVPESLELDPLLPLLRGEGLQMAIVVDEFGGTAGVVTLEDVIEEIVGDISDEHDRIGSSSGRRIDGSWFLSGLLRPDEASEIVEIELPEDDDYSTIAGLLIELLGRMPEIGDQVTLGRVRALKPEEDKDGNDVYQWYSATLTVERLDGYRIDRIRLQATPVTSTTLNDSPTEPDHRGGAQS